VLDAHNDCCMQGREGWHRCQRSQKQRDALKKVMHGDDS
jgi:hypothetical protein